MKTTNLRWLLLSLVIIAACSKDDNQLNQEEQIVEIEETEVVQRTPLTPIEINSRINTQLEETGKFDWKDADDHLLWSALVHGDFILTVGYGAEGQFSREPGDAEMKSVKKELVRLATDAENEGLDQRRELEMVDDEVLNLFDIKVEKLATIQRLRAQDNVRYLEPAGYRYLDYEGGLTNSGSGCDFDGANLDSQDYRTIAPGSRVPWTFDKHNVTQAWSYSTGSGIGIAVIDTGLSPNQYLLNGGINDGYSSGRTVQKYGFYVDSWWPWSTSTDGPNDQCGHGTSMASAAAAPRNNDNLPVGVAYNADLFSYRGTSDVVLNGYHEQRGVANALKNAANKSDVNIISMSIGYPFSIGRIKDAVRYAYGKGKLIFAAGGTSTSFTNFVGVIFPAWMSECVAVTGVKDSGYTKCDICHSGSEIEFTIQMERSNTGKKMPVLGYYNGDNDYVGGSSVATATTAGIAALVWAKNPGWSRSQVLNKLRQSGDFYPNKHSKFGYGNIDALKAVQ